jgi:broad specificity phosphatase PhoE
MTTLLLIRHAETDAVGKLIAGSLPGWHLNSTGKAQAARLAERLRHIPIAAIYTSPLERAVETAEPIASQHQLELNRLSDLEEMRMGAWEGMTIADLDQLIDRRRFNAYRSGVRAPGGELMIQTQMRAVRQLDLLRERHPNQCVAIVSHADVLRASLAHFLGMPLDLMLRMEISPASLSVVELGDWAPRVLCINDTGDVPL